MAEILALSLGLTLVFELLYGWLWGVKGRDILLIAGMNVLTNPLVVLWHYSTQAHGLVISTILPELTAVAVEALLLCRFGRRIRKPVLLAMCINVFSYFVGILINIFLL